MFIKGKAAEPWRQFLMINTRALIYVARKLFWIWLIFKTNFPQTIRDLVLQWSSVVLCVVHSDGDTGDDDDCDDVTHRPRWESSICGGSNVQWVQPDSLWWYWWSWWGGGVICQTFYTSKIPNILIDLMRGVWLLQKRWLTKIRTWARGRVEIRGRRFPRGRSGWDDHASWCPSGKPPKNGQI